MADNGNGAESAVFSEDKDTTTFRETWRKLGSHSDPRNGYLTALNGDLIGRTFGLGAGRLIVGRADDCDIVLHDSGVSRRHALLVVTPEGDVSVEDLHSKNGLTINGRLTKLEALQGGERLQFGSKTVFKFEYRDAIEEEYATYLYESATQDRLTGVFNRRYLVERMVSEFAWHQRHQLPLALIFLDIDQFKAVNDEHGHLTGDEILRQVARRCLAETRTEDIFARYGGEEFACLLRRTPLAGATVIAERMRAAVAAGPLRGVGETAEIAVTVSAGVAELAPDIQSPEALIAAADALLYEAKRAGRNRVLPTPLSAS